MVVGRVPKNTRLETLIGFKVKVTTNNTSTFIGSLKSYDKFMNLVLTECEEFRLTKKSKKYLGQTKNEEVDEGKIREQKRFLGLVLVRGENVVSVVAEAAPNSKSLKPQLRIKKGKVSINPLKRKIACEEGDNKTNSGVKKPTTRK